MTLDNTTKWIQDVLVPRILKKGFRGATLKTVQVRAMPGMKDNWASDMYEINLLLSDQGENKTPSFLLKVMCEDEKVRVQMKSDKQFFNEIHFYSTVKPLFNSQTNSSQLKQDLDKLFPECYYSFYNNCKKPETFEDAVLAMENLKLRDFKLGDRLYLDFKHCLLAMRSSGIFHAFSYFMKEKDPHTFMNVVVKPIQETNYHPAGEQNINKIWAALWERVTDGLSSELKKDDPRLSRIRSYAARKTFDMFTELVQHNEPLAVLCHGDFLRNNVLFRYENGEPVEIKFIDFQTIRYASPAIDLSLLLCMNTTHELRKAHFHELLQEYHSSLTATLAALMEKPEDQLDEKYSFQYFLADFRRHAIYGFLIAIEFFPWMIAEGDELEEFLKLNWTERGSPKFCEASQRLGGEKGTRALVLLTIDLLENQCL